MSTFRAGLFLLSLVACFEFGVARPDVGSRHESAIAPRDIISPDDDISRPHTNDEQFPSSGVVTLTAIPLSLTPTPVDSQATASFSPLAAPSPYSSTSPSTSPSPSKLPSSSPSPTRSRTRTLTRTRTRTHTRTSTRSRTYTPSSSPTSSFTTDITTPDPTSTPVYTASEWSTETAAPSTESSPTQTPSSLQHSDTPTYTDTPSKTPTKGRTGSRTPTSSRTPSRSRAPSLSPSNSRTPSKTHTATRSPTNSRSPSKTPTVSRSPSHSRTPSRTPTNTRTPSKTPTGTRTPTNSRTPSRSPSSSRSPSKTPSPSRTPSVTRSPSRSPTNSRTPSKTYTPSRTASKTPSPSRSVSRTPSPSKTRSKTPTASRTHTRTRTRTPTRTVTRTPSKTPTRTFSPKITATRSPTRSPSLTRTPVATHPLVGPICVACIRVTVDTPEYVTYPWAQEPFLPDQALVTVKLPNGEFRGFTAMGTSYLMIESRNLSDIIFPPKHIGLRARTPTYYTHDLEAVWYDPEFDIIRGWVHIELGTGDGTQSFYIGEIAYTESNDTGYTWKPNSFLLNRDVVIRSASPYHKTAAQILASGTKNAGTGAHWVVEKDEYLYIYWVDFWAELPDGSNKTGRCVARALKSSGGRPGTWLKYYRGSFSEPGIKGKCSSLIGMGGTAVFRVPQFTSANHDYLFAYPAGVPGSGAVSLDAKTWYPLFGHVVPQMLSIQAGISNTAVYGTGYFSVIADENDKMWLYGLYRNPIDNPDGQRNIVRWPLTFSIVSSGTCFSRVGLTRWRLRSDPLVTQITWYPTDGAIWAPDEEILGYVTSCFGRRLTRLVICTLGTKYFIGLESECNSTARAPDGSSTRPVFAGGLGTMITTDPALVTPTDVANLVPLYRCFHPTRKIFDASAGRVCQEPFVAQKLLGYVMPSNYDNALFSVGSSSDPFYDPTYDQTTGELLANPDSADKSSSPSSTGGANGMSPAIVGAICAVVGVGLVMGTVVAVARRNRRSRIAPEELHGMEPRPASRSWIDMSHSQVSRIHIPAPPESGQSPPSVSLVIGSDRDLRT